MKRFLSLILSIIFLTLLTGLALAVDSAAAHPTVASALLAAVDLYPATPEELVQPAVVDGLLNMLPLGWKAAVVKWAPLAALILGILLKVSEYLSMTDRFKANGVVQALGNGLRKVLQYLPKGAGLLALLLLCGCASVGPQTFNLDCGSSNGKQEASTKTSDSTKLDGNSASVQAGYNKGAGTGAAGGFAEKAMDAISGAK